MCLELIEADGDGPADPDVEEPKFPCLVSLGFCAFSVDSGVPLAAEWLLGETQLLNLLSENVLASIEHIT